MRPLAAAAGAAHSRALQGVCGFSNLSVAPRCMGNGSHTPPDVARAMGQQSPCSFLRKSRYHKHDFFASSGLESNWGSDKAAGAVRGASRSGSYFSTQSPSQRTSPPEIRRTEEPAQHSHHHTHHESNWPLCGWGQLSLRQAAEAESL